MCTISIIIFVVTYTGIIFTRLPGINVDRPSAAFLGAVAMILFGVTSFEEAIMAIDFNTIALLLGMMIIITTLQLDGFFSFVARKTISYSKTQFRLLVIVVFVTGIASAFLVNDVVVLLFTPILIAICRSSGLNPVPYLIAEILASNTGSAMTITGNPQNMLIGISSGIPYARFLVTLLPVSLLGLVVIVVVVRVLYHSDFRNGRTVRFQGGDFHYEYASMKYSVPIFLGVTVCFFFSARIGLAIPTIALLGASLVLVFGKIKPSKIIRNVDWVLLLFFASLFVVVEGAVKAGLFDKLVGTNTLKPGLEGILVVHGLSLLMSQVVSNVPFTILMLPVLGPIRSDLLWLSLASASTVAGNATIIGAMANLIVIESAERHNVHIGFWEFLKAGPVTVVLSFGISVAVLAAA